MKFYIGASEPVDTMPFSEMVKFYTRQLFSHIYTRYKDPFTFQDMISESSHGEAHKMTIGKWYLANRIVEEYEIEVSEEVFRAILIRINQRLQSHYSFRNIAGVLVYDLGEKIKFSWLKSLAIKFFSDGEEGTICSESASFTLRLLGIQFNRPMDFVRPDHVIKKLRQLEKTEDYIKRVLP